MDSLIDLLEKIRKRPGMYIGKPSVILLHTFIQGWLLGLDKPPKDLDVLKDFQRWIASRFKISSSHSWAQIIDFYSVDSADALDNFYDLFDEFRSLASDHLREI